MLFEGHVIPNVEEAFAPLTPEQQARQKVRAMADDGSLNLHPSLAGRSDVLDTVWRLAITRRNMKTHGASKRRQVGVSLQEIALTPPQPLVGGALRVGAAGMIGFLGAYTLSELNQFFQATTEIPLRFIESVKAYGYFDPSLIDLNKLKPDFDFSNVHIDILRGRFDIFPKVEWNLTDLFTPMFTKHNQTIDQATSVFRNTVDSSNRHRIAAQAGVIFTPIAAVLVNPVRPIVQVSDRVLPWLGKRIGGPLDQTLR